MVLAAGFFGIELGTVMLLLAFMNRARDEARRTLQWLFLYVGGTAVCESLLLKMEYISRSDMHSALFYIVVAIGTPAVLIAVAVASRQRWACTIMAGVYTAFGLAFLWILPLFPAEPKLGPVYRQVTHFIPWEFPLLLIVPARGDRPDPAAHRRLAADRPRAGRRAWSFSIAFIAVAVAVRELPDDAARAQLVLRHALHGLQHAGALALRAQSVLPARSDGGAVLARDADRGARLVPDDVARHSTPGARCRGSSGDDATRRCVLALVAVCGDACCRAAHRRTSAAPTCSSTARPDPIACW